MIEATSLSRQFGEFVAVDDLTLRVPDGSILALLGPNGAGKTTTVRMLAGLLAPSSGSAVIAGHDVLKDPAGVRARVGLVTDVPGVYGQMTLPAYLDFFAQIYGLDGETRRARISELIDFFELGEHQQERMVGFSKGMKQKVALARALLHEPQALFLDEPTSGLDPIAARAVRDLITGLRNARRTIVLCTHDLAEAERLADEIAIIRRGRLVSHGSPAVLRADASPETLVRIELAEPCPAAPDLLEHSRGVLNPAYSVRASGGLIVYRTARPSVVNPEVLGALVAVGARVISVVCETRTLEEVYADMIEDEKSARQNAVPSRADEPGVT